MWFVFAKINTKIRAVSEKITYGKRDDNKLYSNKCWLWLSTDNTMATGSKYFPPTRERFCWLSCNHPLFICNCKRVAHHPKKIHPSALFLSIISSCAHANLWKTSCILIVLWEEHAYASILRSASMFSSYDLIISSIKVFFMPLWRSWWALVYVLLW